MIRAGAAYYGGDWTVNSEPTTDMWLKELSWATLHEIAHGYQAGFDGKICILAKCQIIYLGSNISMKNMEKKQMTSVGCLI